MSDTKEISNALIELYNENDKMMNFSLKLFIKLSGLAKIRRDAAILDCGCGMGYLINHLKAFGFNNIFGLEYCSEMAQTAERITNRPIFTGDVLKMNEIFKPKSFDIIIFSSMLHHLPDINHWRLIMRMSSELLTKNGLIFIKEPSPTPFMKLFIKLSDYKCFYIGFLKSRLKGYAEERDLHKYFFLKWTTNYKTILSDNNFRILRDFTGPFHRVTVASVEN